MLEKEREEKWRQLEALCQEREEKLNASMTTNKTSSEKEAVQEVANTEDVVEENTKNGSHSPDSDMEEGGEEVGTGSDICAKSET